MNQLSKIFVAFILAVSLNVLNIGLSFAQESDPQESTQEEETNTTETESEDTFAQDTVYSADNTSEN